MCPLQEPGLKTETTNPSPPGNAVTLVENHIGVDPIFGLTLGPTRNLGFERSNRRVPRTLVRRGS